MKDLAILSSKLIFLILISLKNLWQGIYSYIYLALVVIDLEIVLRELLGQMNLSGAQTFYIHKTTVVIMVYEDKNLMLAAYKVIALCLENFDNS